MNVKNISDRTYDVLAMGRSSIDLYSNDIGAPFEEITSFAAFVGGCPTNISVGARRLGLNPALLTAVGEDKVGDFILHFLRREGIETKYIPRKHGKRSSAVVLGIEPPARFPLTYYRDNCADIALTIDDVLASPVADSRMLLISGTGLSQEPSRSATLFAAETAQAAGTTVVLDIDFRPDQWDDPRAFGVVVRSALRVVDIVLGTEDEINAAMLTDQSQVSLTHSQVSDARVSGDVQAAIQTLLSLGPQVLVQKRGASGTTVHLSENGNKPRQIEVPGFPVEVRNILGAGDAFAAGVLYGFVQGWDWYKTIRLANACGAILVTQHGCANFMPTHDEAMTFIQNHGGF
jgi:5-dehydro-2-deoxygluconokinase